MTDKEIIEKGCDVYAHVAILLATQNLTFDEAVKQVLSETSCFHINKEGIDVEYKGIRYYLINGEQDVILSTIFYVELEDGDWTEMQYNQEDNEFVWMDEVVEPQVTPFITTQDGREWNLRLEIGGEEIELTDELKGFATNVINAQIMAYVSHCANQHNFFGYIKEKQSNICPMDFSPIGSGRTIRFIAREKC